LIENFSDSVLSQYEQKITKINFNELPERILTIYQPSTEEDDNVLNLGQEEDVLLKRKEKTYGQMGKGELNFLLNQAIDTEDWKKAEEISKYMKESMNNKKKKRLIESAQIGNTVMFDKQKGYVIGQTNNGDLIIQVQGSSHIANPNDVKVLGAKVETLVKPPFKFDKLTLQNLTTKALFEQFVKCGIFMGSVPIKMNDCYIKYNEWIEASDDKPVNVLVEGSIALLPKSQIRILEDVNDFANLENYVDGVEIDEASGEATSNIKINAADYTEAIGDADPVRIIRGGESQTPTVDTVPRATVRTLAI